MLQLTFLFVGVTAVLATGVALSTQTEAAALFPNDDGIAIMSGVVGFLAWGFFAFGALNVEVVSNGSVVSTSMPQVTYFSIAMAVIPGYVALTGPVQIVRRARNTSAKDV